MNYFAIALGIARTAQELSGIIKGLIDDWKRDNPNEPVPQELSDAALILGLGESISDARGTYADLIARLEARVAAEG